MHTHACPLYSLTKLLGLAFTPSGVSLAPTLPLATFRFESPLLGLIKSDRGYDGWYNPGSRGEYSVRLRFSSEEAKLRWRFEVGGKKIDVPARAGGIEMRGWGGGGDALRWSAAQIDVRG
jgi:hypothetical protein